MVKLKHRTLAPTTKTLGTPSDPIGKLTDCPCCCDELPPQLYVHFEPTFGPGNADCEESDTGQLSTRVDWFLDETGGPANACNQWDTGLTTQPIPADLLECAGVGGGPPVSFGIGLSLYCRPVNKWWVDVCLADTGVPNYPGAAPGACDQILEAIEATSSDNRTCEREPGGFLVDVGDILPFGDNSGLTIYGKNVTGTASECQCPFHLWIDEDPDGGAASVMNPVRAYPAEAGGGDVVHFPALWTWENTPGVGTPQHPKKHPTMAPKRVGVGTRMGRRLAKARINYREAGGGCNCSQLLIEMNRTPPEQILANIDDWTAKVKDSARLWFRNLPGTAGGYMKQALRPLAAVGTRTLIKRACEDELAGKP